MKIYKTLLLAPLLMLSMACSQQWREADDGMASDEVAMAIDEMVGNAGTSSVDAAGTFRKLYESSSSAIYYAFSQVGVNTSLGMPWNVIAVQDFTVFGVPGLNVYDLTGVRIALIDDPASGQAALVFDHVTGKSDSTTTTKFFATSLDNQPQVIDDELVFTFNDGLVAKTRDVEDDGELKPVIQLKLYYIDSTGSESYLGRITTLIGYD